MIPSSPEYPCSSGFFDGRATDGAAISDHQQPDSFSKFESTIPRCVNCFALGHVSRQCLSPIRCKSCWRYGHRAKHCYSNRRPKTKWQPKPSAGNRKQWKSKTSAEEGNKGQNPSRSDSAPNSSPSFPPPPTSASSPSTEKTPAPFGDSPFIVDDDMANFACNPQPYLPPGVHVEHGWLRPARSRVVLGGYPPRRHEEYGIITLIPEPPEHIVLEALQAVVDHLEQAFPVRIMSIFRSPLGLGLVKFQSANQRQSMIDLSPMPFVNNSVIRVIKHDAARNFRACPYIHLCRVMILCFPLDYHNMEFFKAAVAPFGRLISWHEGPNKTKSLLDCLVLTPERIPRSVVVSRGSQLGGNGESWSAPIYIIGGQFLDDFPGEENPVPADGNPHPLHDHVLHVNPDVPQHWVHDLAGAATDIQADFGVQEQQMQEAMDELAPHDNPVEDHDEDDIAQDMDVDNVEDVDAVQQESITFDQSGSSAQYLRAHGLDS